MSYLFRSSLAVVSGSPWAASSLSRRRHMWPAFIFQVVLFSSEDTVWKESVGMLVHAMSYDHCYVRCVCCCLVKIQCGLAEWVVLHWKLRTELIVMEKDVTCAGVDQDIGSKNNPRWRVGKGLAVARILLQLQRYIFWPQNKEICYWQSMLIWFDRWGQKEN